jgi:multisubunit Na+/H+ antiporter MnhF subunit
MGYAAFPFSLSLLMFIPGLSFGIALAAIVLWFVMSTYAVQAASNAPSDRVVMANAIGFIVFAVFMALIARQSGLTTGVFVNAESRAIAEGEYYDLDLGGLEDLINP